MIFKTIKLDKVASGTNDDKGKMGSKTGSRHLKIIIEEKKVRVAKDREKKVCIK